MPNHSRCQTYYLHSHYERTINQISIMLTFNTLHKNITCLIVVIEHNLCVGSHRVVYVTRLLFQVSFESNN